jgi:hypothetical protein
MFMNLFSGIILGLWKNYFEAKSLSFYFDEMKEN